MLNETCHSKFVNRECEKLFKLSTCGDSYHEITKRRRFISLRPIPRHSRFHDNSFESVAIEASREERYETRSNDEITIDVIGVIRNNYWRIKLVRKRYIYIKAINQDYGNKKSWKSSTVGGGKKYSFQFQEWPDLQHRKEKTREITKHA